MMVGFMKKQVIAWRSLSRANPVNEARELFMDLGRELGQRAIYFEVRDAGEITDLD
jgi:hypothetical protein